MRIDDHETRMLKNAAPELLRQAEDALPATDELLALVKVIESALTRRVADMSEDECATFRKVWYTLDDMLTKHETSETQRGVWLVWERAMDGADTDHVIHSAHESRDDADHAADGMADSMPWGWPRPYVSFLAYGAPVSELDASPQTTDAP